MRRKRLSVTDARPVICILSATPCLVLISTTPLAPRTPYTAVAEASFNTEKLSISAGSMSLILPSSPSISTKAEAFAPKVPIPRIQKSEIFLPGSPLASEVITPATRPPSRLLTDVVGRCKSLVSMVVTADKVDILRCVPNPVTTTSSILLSLTSLIAKSDLFPITTYCCF